MQDDYLNRLAPDVQALVNEVEHGAGLEVEVRVDPSRMGRGPDAAGILACHVTEYHAHILIPTPDRFPDGAVVHELLHIDRILVQGVPQVSDFGHPRQSDALTDLDNALEHLVIVPTELTYRPDRANHWNRIMESTWRDKLPSICDRDDQSRWAKMHWVFLHHVLPGSDVAPVAEQLLEELGIADDARRFHEALIPGLGSKERTVRLSFHHLGLPLEIAALEYLDSRRRSRREVQLVNVRGE